MDYFHTEIDREAKRWDQIVGSNDNYETEQTLGIKDVLKAHFLIADFFKEEGMGLSTAGPKSLELLHSALYRPFVGFGGKYKWTDLFDIAATVLYGLVMNHPFHDANKRTAFLSTLFFLQKRGYVPSVSQKKFEDFLVSIADHQIEESKRYQEYKKKYEDPEIKYISFWLKRNTRQIDTKQYIITYRELKRILNRFDFDLQSPRHNGIDVMKKKEKTSFLGFGEKKVVWQRIGTIGFPDWRKQVTKNDLKNVRELTDLTAQKGCDSQVFYRDADPLNSLIAEYQEPLRRLADR